MMILAVSFSLRLEVTRAQQGGHSAVMVGLSDQRAQHSASWLIDETGRESDEDLAEIFGRRSGDLGARENSLLRGGSRLLSSSHSSTSHQGIWMSGLSLARRERLRVERLGDEVVVYDRDADVAHCLSPSVAAVWERADGTRSDDQIAVATGLSDTEVADALGQLRTVGLIEEPTADGGADGHTRREATKRIVRAGALAAAAPLIYTLAISPAAAMASGLACDFIECQGRDLVQTTATGMANESCQSQSLVPGGFACATCDVEMTQFLDNEWVVSGICNPSP
jgi:hypothetical protein